MEEYRLKAAFVSGFAGFVEWPPEALKNPSDPIAVCVFGENPFGSALEQAIKGKTVQEHKLLTRHVPDVQQSTGCQILFVAPSERRRLRSILKEGQLNSVLTVGDSDNFTAEGGMIELRVEGEQIQILINLSAAEKNRLKISSRLLSLARIVKK